MHATTHAGPPGPARDPPPAYGPDGRGGTVADDTGLAGPQFTPATPARGGTWQHLTGSWRRKPSYHLPRPAGPWGGVPMTSDQAPAGVKPGRHGSARHCGRSRSRQDVAVTAPELPHLDFTRRRIQ